MSNFINWTRFLQEIKKARGHGHDPGKNQPEKEKVLHDDKNYRRAKTTKH